MSASWSVVVPQKDLRRAKSRLLLGGRERQRIVVAMFDDVLAAIRAVPAVKQIIVVCDHAADADTLRRPGVSVAIDAGGGLNTAIDTGAELARRTLPEGNLAVLPADLPAIRPAELDQALAIAAGHARSFIADAAGTGTTLLAASHGHRLRPEYGPSSRARHLLSGAVAIGTGQELQSLRDDVDDLESLQRAARAPGARHTRQALEEIGTDWAGRALSP